jgi:hypothetical protein
MNMLKVSFILFLWWPATSAQPQPSAAAADDFISWNEFYKIQWHDFQGKPTEESIGDAGASVQIKAKPFLIKRKVNYDVVALFNRKKSWARDYSESLLAHERLHFDIAELYARKIRKKVKELNDEGVADIKTYNAAVQELLLESNDADRRYDMETLHGALLKKQATWAGRVKQELSELQRYKKSKRIIGAG